MRRARQVFDEDFKKRALELVASGRTASSVAQELGVDVERIYKWKREQGTAIVSGQKTVKELETELRAMKKRAERAEMEAAVLKKAVSIFSSSPGKD